MKVKGFEKKQIDFFLSLKNILTMQSAIDTAEPDYAESEIFLYTSGYL